MSVASCEPWQWNVITFNSTAVQPFSQCLRPPSDRRLLSSRAIEPQNGQKFNSSLGCPHGYNSAPQRVFLHYILGAACCLSSCLVCLMAALLRNRPVTHTQQTVLPVSAHFIYRQEGGLGAAVHGTSHTTFLQQRLLSSSDVLRTFMAQAINCFILWEGSKLCTMRPKILLLKVLQRV